MTVDALGRTMQREGDPLVQFDAIRQPTLVMRGSAETVLGKAAVRVALRQTLDGVLDGARGPEFLFGEARRLAQLALVPDLHEQDVPGGERHDHENDQRALGDEVSLRPKGTETVGIVNNGGGLVFHRFLCFKRGQHREVPP